jgi:hypothetical protein
MTSPDIDILRQQYCATTHQFDNFVPKDQFSANEIQLITQYGKWFDAILRGDVPLVTDKLRHFYSARSRNFETCGVRFVENLHNR